MGTIEQSNTETRTRMLLGVTLLRSMQAMTTAEPDSVAIAARPEC